MAKRTDERPLRSFLFVSEERLNEYFNQIADRRRRKVLSRVQFSFGFGMAPFNLSVQPRSDGTSTRDRSLAQRVERVEETIRELSGVGDLAVGDHWISGRVDMTLEPLTDGQTVLFCGYAGPLLVALHGSVGHLSGRELSGSGMGSYAHAVTAALLAGADRSRLGERLVAAASEANFAPRPVRFLAWVTGRGKLGGAQQREFVLATPLYVEEAYREAEAAGALLQGTVRSFSGERGWGLVNPDGDEDSVVVDSATESPNGAQSPLVPGQRVEFRVTHGATGILASSVRALDGPGGAHLDVAALGQPLEADDPPALGGYTILRRLGGGAMGVVYLARGDTDDLVAIKMILPHLARLPEFLRRFEAEAGNASRVQGPNLSRVITSGTDAGRHFLISEFVAGPTLKEQIDRHGPLRLRSAIDAAAGIAAALEDIHRAGVVHRDLTPANVILSDSGPKVVDFGIAQMVGSGTKLTQYGWPIGTPAYMSPEQVNQQPLTAASDIFSWAGLMVFAVTGHPPFDTGGPSRPALWDAIRQDKPNLRGVPNEIRQVISAALHKDPAQRPTAAEVSRALHDCLPEQTPQAPRRRWPRLVAFAALVSAAVVVAAVAVTIDLTGGGGKPVCPSPQQAGYLQVNGQSSAAARAGLTICSVQVDHGQSPGLNTYLAGTILGHVPSGQLLIVASQPDRDSCGADGIPGTGGYYYLGQVQPDSHGAWNATSGPYYSGAQAIQRHFYFLLGSQSAVDSFRQAQTASGGALTTGSDFQLLGSFTFTPVQPPDKYCSG